MTAGGQYGGSLAPLKGREIALSIGDVDPLELLDAGLSGQHLADAAMEISRHLLARGATLAYGGAPAGTFTESLLDLVESHLNEGELHFERLRNYVAEAFMPADPDDYVGKRIKVVDLRMVSAPADVRGLPFKAGPAVPEMEARYVRARHLTEMRRVMTAEQTILARVALGGKLYKFSGRYPGIPEEVLMFVEQNRPVYVLGGFGGGAAAVARALRGDAQSGLSAESQEKNQAYAEFCDYYRRRIKESDLENEYPIDYPRMQQVFRERGGSGLRNGLTAEENLILFESQDLMEIIYYLLKGLTTLGNI